MVLAASCIVIPASMADFDLVLCDYIDMCWCEGEVKSHIGDLLSGLGHFVPALRNQMPGAWRLHAKWGRLELPERAWSLTLLQALAIAGYFWRRRLRDAMRCV